MPLELRGLAMAHARHGSLPWARLVTPVLPYARDGFPAHPYLVAALSSNVTLFKCAAPLAVAVAAGRAAFFHDMPLLHCQTVPDLQRATEQPFTSLYGTPARNCAMPIQRRCGSCDDYCAVRHGQCWVQYPKRGSMLDAILCTCVTLQSRFLTDQRELT